MRECVVELVLVVRPIPSRCINPWWRGRDIDETVELWVEDRVPDSTDGVEDGDGSVTSVTLLLCPSSPELEG